jgi:hypothetical protein
MRFADRPMPPFHCACPRLPATFFSRCSSSWTVIMASGMASSLAFGIETPLTSDRPLCSPPSSGSPFDITQSPLFHVVQRLS